VSFLRRLLGGGGDEDQAPPAPSGAPQDPIVVADPRATLEEQLRALVARPELEFLIVLWDARRNLYAQFAPTNAGELVGELTGDRYLEPRHRLRPEQRSGLAGLGWRDDADGGNWQRTWPVATSPATIAADAVAAMEIHGLPRRAEWTITFGSD